MLILLILLVLHDLLLFGVHESLEISTIFHLETLHCYLLGFSKFLKDCLYKVLSDSCKPSVDITYAFWALKIAYVIGERFCNYLNIFISKTGQRTLGKWNENKFLEDASSARFTEVFAKNSILDIFDEKGHKNIDMQPFFLRNIVFNNKDKQLVLQSQLYLHNLLALKSFSKGISCRPW